MSITSATHLPNFRHSGYHFVGLTFLKSIRRRVARLHLDSAALALLAHKLNVDGCRWVRHVTELDVNC